MRGRIFGGLVVLAVAATAICGGAPPALAADTSWSVTNPNGDGSFEAAGTLAVTNTSTASTMSCSASTLYGTMPTAAGVHELGSLDHSTTTGCTGAGGASAEVFHIGPVYLDGQSYDPATGRATVDGVEVMDSLIVSQPGCEYYASGTYRITYTNSSSELLIDDTTLTVTYTTGSGCSGVATVGDALDVTGTYTVTPAITLVARPARFTVTGSAADGRYTTTQSATTTHVLGDLATGNHSLCSDATVAGRFPNGSDLLGAGIGSVTSANLGTCWGFPGGGVYTITPVNLPWRLDAVSYVATDGGYVTGSIANFELSVSGPGCSFSVTNTPYATDWRYGVFNDTPDVLLISLQRAEIANVQGCGGEFNDGDQASYSNAYAVSPISLQITGR